MIDLPAKPAEHAVERGLAAAGKRQGVGEVALAQPGAQSVVGLRIQRRTPRHADALLPDRLPHREVHCTGVGLAAVGLHLGERQRGRVFGVDVEHCQVECQRAFADLLRVSGRAIEALGFHVVAVALEFAIGQRHQPRLGVVVHPTSPRTRRSPSSPATTSTRPC